MDVGSAETDRLRLEPWSHGDHGAGLAHPLWWPEMVERTEVGWRLAPDAWGAGYATEGAREAVRIGFDRLALDEIVSFVHPGNTRSLAVTRRLGMLEEAVVPHPSRDELVQIVKLERNACSLL